MEYFDQLVSQLNGYVGKTISAINTVESFDGGEIARLEFVFESGETLDISPTGYNYGAQDLCITFND